MSKITYLFGAGASCGTMPLVSNMPEKMKEMIEFLSLDENQLSNIDRLSIQGQQIYGHGLYSKLDFQKQFINDLKDLEFKSKNHFTIDTYAKKLFVTQKSEELYLLKILLSCYLTLEQLKSAAKCDNRYDSFWASLIGKSFADLPDNVRILTWNYDIQIELSFSEYCYDKKFTTALEALNIHVNNNKKNSILTTEKFGIYKLNGSANALLDLMFPDRNWYIWREYERGLNIETIEQVIAIYSVIKYFRTHFNIGITLSFAWECPIEHNDRQTSFIKSIENEIIDTEILVVIGYSFPFFNRAIDRAIIRPMKNLKKVYIQDKAPENVITSFRSIRDDWGDEFPKKVEPIFVKDATFSQFFLPPEL